MARCEICGRKDCCGSTLCIKIEELESDALIKYDNHKRIVSELKAELETYKKALRLCNEMNTINASHRPDPNFYTDEDWLAKAKEDK